VHAPGRPEMLGPGDRVRSQGAVRTVVGLSGPLVRLADTSGVVTTVALSVLQAHQDFAVLDRRARPSVPSVATLDVSPAATVEQALW
jgi:hypothetical protein